MFVAGLKQEAALCSLSGSTRLSTLQFVALQIRAVGVVLPYGALLKNAQSRAGVWDGAEHTGGCRGR